MTTTGRGPRGNPIIGNPPTRIADYAAISNYAAVTGNRIIDVESSRINFTAVYGYAPYEGLEFYETDTNYLSRFQDGFWRYLEYTTTIAPAGTVTTNPAEGYVTFLRLSHGIVSCVLNVGPGPNGFSASSSNNLIGGVPSGLRPATALVKRGEWRPADAWSGTDWAKVRFTVDGNITVVYTTATIPNSAHLTVEASWPAS